MAKLIDHPDLPLAYYVGNVKDHMRKIQRHALKTSAHLDSIELALNAILTLYGKEGIWQKPVETAPTDTRPKDQTARSTSPSGHATACLQQSSLHQVQGVGRSR